MNGNNSVPNIRFKGFQDDWENDSIKNVSTMKSGGTPSVNKREYYVGDIPFIRSSDIKKKTTELKINDEALKNSSSFVVEKGTVLYALYGATSGQVAISKVTGAINQAVLAIFPDEFVNKYFLLYWLSFNKGKITNKYLQGGQGNLSAKIVKNLLLFFPSKQEQQKISNFFAKLDKLLDLQQQKIDKLELLKKALLQKLFPRHDARIPEFRFKGFEDVWESMKFKNILNYERPDKYIVKSDNYSNNGIPVLTANKSFILGYTQESSFYEKPLPIIIFDDFTLDCKLVKFPFKIKSSAIKILSSNNFSDIWFDFYLLKSTSFIKEGHARHYISIVQNKKINVPCEQEQQKIGNLLSKVDQLIELENKKLQNFQQLKKCLLQNMFVE